MRKRFCEVCGLEEQYAVLTLTAASGTQIDCVGACLHCLSTHVVSGAGGFYWCLGAEEEELREAGERNRQKYEKEDHVRAANCCRASKSAVVFVDPVAVQEQRR